MTFYFILKVDLLTFLFLMRIVLELIIVTGGNNAKTSVELLFPNGTRLCSLPNLLVGRHFPSQTGLVTCGSSEAATCETFIEGSWVETHTLSQRRHQHSAWASPQGVLIIGSSYGSATTTELLTDDGNTSPGFTLDYATRGACSIEEEQEVVITGGHDKLSLVTKYQMSGQSQSLPSLNTGRHWHACGYFTNTNGNIVSSEV